MLGMLKNLLILVFITVIIAIVAGIYFVKFDNSSELGSFLKNYALKNPQFIRFFNLNQPGDNRYIYLSSLYPDIEVNVAYTLDAQPDSDAEAWIRMMIGDTVGKNIRVNLPAKPNIASQDSFTDKDLNRIRKTLINNQKSNLSVVNIIYLSTYAEKPSYLGVTIHRDTIFIFNKTLKKIVGDSELTKRLERSTLMHEWGHLLNLPHIQQSGCVMSGDMDIYSDRPLFADEIPITHCPSTLYFLEQLKKEAIK